MASTINGFGKFVSSVLTFGAFMLAIIIAAYQVFAPEGHVFIWLKQLWNTSPILVIALGGCVLLLKRKLDGQNGTSLANTLLYLAVLIGLVVGISWLF